MLAGPVGQLCIRAGEPVAGPVVQDSSPLLLHPVDGAIARNSSKTRARGT